MVKRLPGDRLTASEMAALVGFADKVPRTAAQASANLWRPRRAVGNFGATVRRLYEKGCLSFRHPEADYRITNLGLSHFKPPITK